MIGFMFLLVYAKHLNVGAHVAYSAHKSGSSSLCRTTAMLILYA